jgi:hypothetical protein
VRKADGPSWQVSIDMPYGLQLPAYVGRQEGFAAPAGQDQPPGSPAEADWREWWELAIAHVGDPDYLVAMYANPPEFDGLADRPLLQELCRRHWDGFREDSKRRKPDLTMHAELRGLDVNGIVKGQERRLGRRVQPFKFRLDFTHWPSGYHRDVTDGHTVLGAGYLEPDRLGDLREIVEARISRLA